MKCNIARDLLPLYFDGLCSEETKEQLEEHLENCKDCRELKQSLEKEQEWPGEDQEWDKPIVPLKKIRKKIRRKNWLIALCLFLLVLLAGGTSLLTYGQITKKGISFEWICDAIRFQHIGKQFADGEVEALYEVLSNGYRFQDEESGIIRLAYGSQEAYDTDMKGAILEKYSQYFGEKGLAYAGIEDIGYREIPGMGWSRTLCISLKFEGENNLAYYMTFYKSLDGQYMVDDYFGNPYITYTDSGEATGMQTGEKPYHTEESLFSCLPNGLKDYDLYLARYMVMTSGQRALQGDTVLAESGQMRLGILSQQDIAENTFTLRDKMNDGLDQLAEQGYYLTDITWSPIEYDKSEHLYRYRLNMELSGPDEIVMTLECYRISDQFVYIPGTGNVYGTNITSEMSGILEE